MSGTFAIEILMRLLGPLVDRMMRRFHSIQAQLTLTYNPYYDASSETFIAIRPADIDDRADPFDRCGSPLNDGAPLVGMFGCPFVFTISVANRHTAELPFYVTELTLEVVRVSPEEEAVRGRLGLHIGSIMAGGRGSEGSFQVRTSIRSKLQIPIFAQTTVQSDGSQPPIRMRVDPGRCGEIAIALWFDTPGKFEVGARASLRSAWRTEIADVSGRLAFVQLSGELLWPDQCVYEHVSGSREPLEHSEFWARLKRRSDIYVHSAPPEVPPGRRVVVQGSCRTEAW